MASWQLVALYWLAVVLSAKRVFCRVTVATLPLKMAGP